MGSIYLFCGFHEFKSQTLGVFLDKSSVNVEYWLCGQLHIIRNVRPAPQTAFFYLSIIYANILLFLNLNTVLGFILLPHLFIPSS